MKILLEYKHFIFTGLSMLSLFGVSVLLGAMSDLLLFSTVHLHFYFYLSCRMQHWCASCMYSLFLLFRGKKWNVLKERVDSQDFSMDQLLLGTVMFSVLVFLYPTFLFYYLLFLAVSHMYIYLCVCLYVHIVIEYLLAVKAVHFGGSTRDSVDTTIGVPNRSERENRQIKSILGTIKCLYNAR